MSAITFYHHSYLRGELHRYYILSQLAVYVKLLYILALRKCCGRSGRAGSAVCGACCGSTVSSLNAPTRHCRPHARVIRTSPPDSRKPHAIALALTNHPSTQAESYRQSNLPCKLHLWYITRELRLVSQQARTHLVIFHKANRAS